VRALIPLAIAGVLAVPASAAARQPEPLVDVAPLTTSFNDRVIEGHGAVRAHAASAPRAYATPDGTSVSVSFGDGYTENQQVAQSYVNFLGSLPHGTELSKIKLLLVPPSQIGSACGAGGGDGVLACYNAAVEQMIVPGEQVESEAGVSTAYVIAHEYGHHIAANRANPPFPTLDFGPKYWASYEKVCDRVLSGRLVPGSEGRFYTANPGESWAEVYARLTYPQESWRFTSLLRPDAGALDAARRDVLDPWTVARTRTFRGNFTGANGNTRSYSFPLALDGGLRIKLHGPSRARYDLAVSSLGRSRGKTSGNAARDVLSWKAACRQRRDEDVTVTVVRRSGTGKFSVDVTYAG